ncbi:alpha-keto acid decarboxylase family protein [Streptomyces sp. NPDC005374]|uniref:alpha-keto acid decarboxylase family protein n=1 Tax=Streptomyces sp. NPDC005374 TaxID=3364713 RepID=UPI00367A9C21
MNQESPSTISGHLLDRIAAAGVRHVFGVPGDYNLALLDEIDDHPLLRWIGNANELNAAYMADGYARLGGFAALVTTYGVGELSAINGIAGSYAESVPVLHVVGAPTREIQRRGLPVHHSLLDGDHGHFLRAAKEVTCAAATLTEETAVQEIDRVVATVLREKKPGYLAIPSDLVGLPCQGAVAPAPATGSVRGDAGDRVRDFSEAAARLLDDDAEVTVLVDSLAARHGVRPELDTLLRKGRSAVAVTPGGKGVIDESLAAFIGVYNGAISAPEVRRKVEQVDVTIGVGLVEHDLNTGGFTTGIETSRLIGLQPSYATVGAQRFEGVTIRQALDELARLVPAALDTFDTVAPAADATPLPTGPATADPSTPLDQDLLWDRLGRFFQPGDIIAADQGTAFYGLIGQRLPADVEVIAQPGWSSIGYGLPAVAGAQLAASPNRRAVLVIGDGAAQLTVQEIGTIAREGLAPIIVLVNNDGYTVERAINGWNAAYNDITRWDWQAAPGALGADAVTAQARTLGELHDALTRFSAHTDRIRFLEVIVGKHDLPQVLSDTARAVAERNSR